MDETFLININCSNILFDSQETQYTMFIDTNKISIVYELVEWIRWIFSVESCIYLTHENSVIHELEDIRVLSKLKNFEIKPCGRPLCVHKKTYRTLLNSLKLFVNWNETKVHKYFFEKVNQMDGKVKNESRNNDNSKDPRFSHGFVENEFVINRTSPNTSCNNQLMNSCVLHANRNEMYESNSDSPSVANSPFKIDCFGQKRNKKDNLLINFEENNIPNAVSQNTNNYNDFSPVKSPARNKLETKDKSGTNSKKKSNKFVRPFSLGQILSNIREDLEKQKNIEGESKKNTGEGNFDEITTEVVETKKRQRTRKRKKAKKQDVKNEFLTSHALESNGFAKSPSFNTNFKPNHIRFDDEPENDLMETDSMEDFLRVQNVEINQNNSNAVVVKTETPAVTEDNCESFSNEHVVSQENPIVGCEGKIIDLDDEDCNKSIQSYNAGDCLSPELQMLQSMKERLKNAVIVKRFY